MRAPEAVLAGLVISGCAVAPSSGARSRDASGVARHEVGAPAPAAALDIQDFHVAPVDDPQSLAAQLARGPRYAPLRDLSFASRVGAFTVTPPQQEAFEVRYRVHLRPSTLHLGARIERTLREASELLLFEFLGGRAPDHACPTLDELDVFVVTDAEINDPGRFGADRSDGGRIAGLFHHWASAGRRSAILLSDAADLDETLAHEVGHYWHARLCLHLDGEEETEPFAQRFERAYRDRPSSGSRPGAATPPGGATTAPGDPGSPRCEASRARGVQARIDGQTVWCFRRLKELSEHRDACPGGRHLADTYRVAGRRMWCEATYNLIFVAEP